MIIVFDTETTGLLAPIAAGQEHQPHLVELAAIKLNDQLEMIDTLILRCRPPIDIPEDAIKIHGISNENVADCQSFVQVLPRITEFFLGSRYLVGHNLMYDKNVLYWELVRLGKVMQFPWAPGAICTVEVCQQYFGHRLNLMDLHIQLFSQSFAGAHSASVDCDVTMRCFVEMVRKEMIAL